MTLWKKGLTLLTAAVLAAGMISGAQAASKKSAKSSSGAQGSDDVVTISDDPGSATIHQNKLLKWGPVNPPYRAKKPEFTFRGAVLSVTKAQNAEKPNIYDIKILPFEVVDNEYRFITFENFKNGIELQAPLNKEQLKLLTKGKAIEYKQWYEIVDQGGQGYAKMIGFVFHYTFTPNAIDAQGYLSQAGLQPEQYLNVVKAIHMSSGKGGDDVKNILDALASSSKVPEVKAEATELLSSIYGAQPTGKPLPVVANAAEPTTVKVKKQK